MAAYCMRELIVPDTHEEWSLVGWSFGGVIAYEMARQMRANGLTVRRLVLIDSYLPSRRETWPPNESHGWRLAQKETSLGPATASSSGQSTSAGELSASTDPLRFEALAALGGPDAASHVYRANVSALGRYRPTGCPVPCFEIRAEQTSSRLSRNGAAPHPLPGTSRRIVVLPGDHYSIMGEQSLNSLAIAVDEGLR
jgi:thioesterase domain-containing protein